MPLVNCGLLVDYSTRNIDYLCYNEPDVDFDYNSWGAPIAHVGRLANHNRGKLDTNAFEYRYRWYEGNGKGYP